MHPGIVLANTMGANLLVNHLHNNGHTHSARQISENRWIDHLASFFLSPVVAHSFLPFRFFVFSYALCISMVLSSVRFDTS